MTPKSPAATPEAGRTAAEAVLVVDDVPANLRQLAEIIGKAGYRVRPAQDGEMALQSAAASPPDLIVLDVRMPKMDGYEVCRRLKRDPRLADIPVIFISALDETADKLEAFAAGGVDYVTKPFQQEEVLARINTHLGMRRMQETLRHQKEELARTVEELNREVLRRVEVEKSLQQEKRLLHRLFQSSDHERQMIAYEIHDGLAQHLTAASMHLQSAKSQAERDPEAADKAFTVGMVMLERGIQEARRLISGVRPPILDDAGVAAAIEHLVRENESRYPIAFEFVCDVNFDRLNPILENAIYRITQESLTNACKYSNSDRVRVEMVQQGEGELRVEIRDWGVGFDPATVREGSYGLEGIRERTRLLGGRVTIESAPGEGTRIAVEFPIILRDESLMGAE